MAGATLAVDVRYERRRLEAHVARAVARLRAQAALQAAVFSLFIVACLLVPLIFVDKLLSLTLLGINGYIIWLGLLALCVPYVLLKTYSNRINGELAAALTDDRLGLHSRLCTALSLAPGDASGFSEAFYAEAAERLARLDPSAAFPVRRPRLVYFLPLPLLLAAGLWRFMPPQDLLGLAAKAKEQRRVERTRKKTAEDLRKRLMKLEDMKKNENRVVSEHSAEYKVKQLIQQAKKLAKQIKDSQRPPEQSIMALAELKRQIAEEKKKIRQGKDFLERLKRLKERDLNLEDGDLTKPISEALKSGDASLAARQMRRLARKLKKEVLDNPNLSEAQKKAALKKLRREMEKLAGALAEQEALRENLQEISKKAMEGGEFASLQNEIKKFQQKQNKGTPGGDKKHLSEELEEMMDDAADELERLEDEDETQLNEDEQAAENDLDELDDSIDEALEGLNEGSSGKASGKHGKTGRWSGKQGGRSRKRKFQGKNAKQQGSSKGQRGRQGGDKQGRQGGGKRRKNGRPGQPSFSGPNQGGKGLGRRAYRDGDALFRPSKVRGKLQSGAITGLSHFRGQGAKGEAPAEYVKALSAAEQEMSSSLELNRIPADARRMVKEYFLNLKRDAGIIHKPAPAPAPAPKRAPAPSPSQKSGGNETLQE